MHCAPGAVTVNTSDCPSEQDTKSEDEDEESKEVISPGNGLSVVLQRFLQTLDMSIPDFIAATKDVVQFFFLLISPKHNNRSF